MTLRDALVDELKRLNHAERQMLSVLPVLARLASNRALHELLFRQILETDTRAARLEGILGLLGAEATCVPSAAMAGIIAQGLQLVRRADIQPLRDALVIAVVRQARYHGMAVYSNAIAWADTLALRDISDLLHQALLEERHAETTLSATDDSRARAQASDWSFDGVDEPLAHRTLH